MDVVVQHATHESRRQGPLHAMFSGRDGYVVTRQAQRGHNCVGS
ncbi:hypothetical protein [Streptomyces misionensis]